MMPRFPEVIGAWPADEPLPDDWRDQLTAAYAEDFDSANAAYTELTGQLEEMRNSTAAEIQRLKAQNYELLMQVPKDDDTPEMVPGIDEDMNTDITIDDLFSDEKAES